MSYTDQDVEEVINAYFVSYRTSKNARGQTADASTVHRKAHEQGVRAARAALDAMAHEPMEDVLENSRLTEMHVAMLVSGKWQVMVTTEGGEWGANDQPVGWGDTLSEAIRNAIKAAKGGE